MHLKQIHVKELQHGQVFITKQGIYSCTCEFNNGEIQAQRLALINKDGEVFTSPVLIPTFAPFPMMEELVHVIVVDPQLTLFEAKNDVR